MSTPETLTVEKREQTGSLRMKRLRQTGKLPAVLYGHGQDNILLTVSEKEVNKAINMGSHIVELKGAANESALIKTVQWDAFGTKVLHLDLTRIDANEKVEVTLPVKLKGDAPGAGKGGMVNFVQHQMTVLVPANQMPEVIEVKITELDVDQVIHAGDVELPAGCELAESEHNAIASCTPKAGSEEKKDEEEE